MKFNKKKTHNLNNQIQIDVLVWILQWKKLLKKLGIFIVNWHQKKGYFFKYLFFEV